MFPRRFKLGLIAYPDDTGLGNQTKLFYDHLRPDKTMVLDRSGLLVNHTPHLERYPDGVVIKSLPSIKEVDEFLEGLDIIFMIEVSPTMYLLNAAQTRGVKTVIMPNWEYFNYPRKPQWPKPDLFLAPSLWHLNDLTYPEPKAHLPVPIEPRPTDKPPLAKNFLHVAGRPVEPDRNGTDDLLTALQYVQSEITMTITCQVPGMIEERLDEYEIPDNVRIIVPGAYEHYWEIYENQDVLVMPRRFGGLCMPVNEALGSGLPVIMPDISPNETWLPPEWLIPATQTGTRMIANEIDIFETDPYALADKIDEWATYQTAYENAVEKAHTIAKHNSWEALLPVYMELFDRILTAHPPRTVYDEAVK